jgi:hypothetical protein
MIIYMLFALIPLKVGLSQLPAETGTILRLIEIVNMRHSISPIENITGGEAEKSEHIYGNRHKHNRFDPDE